MNLLLGNIETEIINDLGKEDIDRPVRRLYELYFDDIVATIIYKGGNADDGADIFQESVLVLIEKIKSGTFRRESNLKTFLSGIAKNLWLAEQRTRERRKSREERYNETSETAILPESWKKQQQGLVLLFDKIGDVCKNILIGFYYENKNMKKLLQEFDFKNEQVLRNRKALCMKKLKEMLAENRDLLQLFLTESNHD